ncbi:MAG: biotin transporter BioY [Lachnospiraceae bacterium]|nr:biotin transporter BioY [Lachnospiraceae bacterium]
MTKAPTSNRIMTSDLVICALFVALIVAGAYIKIMIPIGPFSVTFSLQFLVSLMAGLLLGSRRGALTVFVYLLLGLVGLPVFAHGGGIAYVIRPTFGFLLGFLAAACVSGLISERGENCSLRRMLAAAVAGEAVYYLCGLVYYYFVFNYVVTTGGLGIGVKELIAVWCLSTVVPDFGLALLAVLLSRQLRRYLPGQTAGHKENGPGA